MMCISLPRNVHCSPSNLHVWILQFWEISPIWKSSRLNNIIAGIKFLSLSLLRCCWSQTPMMEVKLWSWCWSIPEQKKRFKVQWNFLWVSSTFAFLSCSTQDKKNSQFFISNYSTRVVCSWTHSLLWIRTLFLDEIIRKCVCISFSVSDSRNGSSSRCDGNREWKHSVRELQSEKVLSDLSLKSERMLWKMRKKTAKREFHRESHFHSLRLLRSKTFMTWRYWINNNLHQHYFCIFSHYHLIYSQQKLWWQHVWPCLQQEMRGSEVLAACLQPALAMVQESTTNEYEHVILPTFK